MCYVHLLWDFDKGIDSFPAYSFSKHLSGIVFLPNCIATACIILGQCRSAANNVKNHVGILIELTQKFTSRLLEGTQVSRWIHGCPQPGGRNGAPTTPPKRSPRTNLTSSTRKRPTGTLVYTELLVGKRCSKSVIGHQGLTEDRTLMQTTTQSSNAN